MLRAGNLIRTVALKLGYMEVRPRSLRFSLVLCDLYFESPCVRLRSLSFVSSVQNARARGWRAVSTVKSEYHSGGGFEFGSSMHTVWFTLSCSSSFREVDTFFCPQGTFHSHASPPRHRNTNTQLKINLKKEPTLFSQSNLNVLRLPRALGPLLSSHCCVTLWLLECGLLVFASL